MSVKIEFPVKQMVDAMKKVDKLTHKGIVRGINWTVNDCRDTLNKGMTKMFQDPINFTKNSIQRWGAKDSQPEPTAFIFIYDKQADYLQHHTKPTSIRKPHRKNLLVPVKEPVTWAGNIRQHRLKYYKEGKKKEKFFFGKIKVYQPGKKQNVSGVWQRLGTETKNKDKKRMNQQQRPQKKGTRKNWKLRLLIVFKKELKYNKERFPYKKLVQEYHEKHLKDNIAQAIEKTLNEVK